MVGVCGVLLHTLVLFAEVSKAYKFLEAVSQRAAPAKSVTLILDNFSAPDSLAENFNRADQRTAERIIPLLKKDPSELIKVRVYMEPRCNHCRAFFIGALANAVMDRQVREAMDLVVSPFGNAFYSIPQCDQEAESDPGTFVGGIRSYDANLRRCYNEKCGLGTAATNGSMDCFAGNLVFQNGEMERHASRYLICAKRLSLKEAVPWRNYVPFFLCMEKYVARIKDGASGNAVASACAERTGLDFDLLAKCYDSREPEEGYREEARLTPPHGGVPWITVDDKVLEDHDIDDSLIVAVRSAIAERKRLRRTSSLLQTEEVGNSPGFLERDATSSDFQQQERMSKLC